MLVVGAILREPLESTMRFVHWYLEQGADQIVLCFDDPNDPAIARLAEYENVRSIPCTRPFWRSIGARPRTRFTRRQNMAMAHIYKGLTEGWFLNVDGDELVYLEGRSLKEELTRQPDSVQAVMIRPAERVYCPQTPEVMQFRTAMPPWCCRGVYGELADAMRRRQGLSGHWIGKSATRAGLSDYRMRQHFMETRQGEQLTDVVLEGDHGAYLLHFVDQGYDTWRSKLQWRLSARGFRKEMAQILGDAFASTNPEQALRKVYNTMFVFDPAQLAKLDRANSRLKIDLRRHVALARHFQTDPALAQLKAA